MKKTFIGMLLLVGLLFGCGTIYAQTSVDMPGNPPAEPDVTLEEVLGRDVCVVDNYGIVYNLTVGGGVITGTAEHPSCGHYSDVSGTYTGKSFSMHVGNPSNPNCVGYTFTGVVNSRTKTASGTWVNDGGGGSGSFTAALCSNKNKSNKRSKR